MKKILLSSLLLIICSSPLAAGNVDFYKIRLLVCEYIEDPYNNKESLVNLVNQALFKFEKEKASREMDDADITLFYGKEGQPGLLDYLLERYRLPPSRKPTPLELSMRRFLELSILDQKVNKSTKELVNECFNKIGKGDVAIEIDVPFLINDGFLSELVKTIDQTKDTDEKAKLIFKTKIILKDLRQIKLDLKQRTKLDNIENNFHKINFSFQHDQAQVKINPKDIRDHLLNSNYFPKYPLYYAKLSIDDLIEEAINSVIQKGIGMDDADIELLVDKGNLYYYLVQRAEDTPKDDPLRGERISRVLLLYDNIRSSAPYEKLPGQLKMKWRSFHQFAGSPVDENLMLYKTFIQKYENEISRRTMDGLPSVTDGPVFSKSISNDLDNMNQKETIKEGRLELEDFVRKCGDNTTGLSDEFLLNKVVENIQTLERGGFFFAKGALEAASEIMISPSVFAFVGTVMLEETSPLKKTVDKYFDGETLKGKLAKIKLAEGENSKAYKFVEKCDQYREVKDFNKIK